MNLVNLKSPDFDVVNLEGRLLSVPGGVPSLLAVVEVKSGIGGGVHPGLGVRGVHGVVGEVAGKVMQMYHEAVHNLGHFFSLTVLKIPTAVWLLSVIKVSVISRFIWLYFKVPIYYINHQIKI